MAGTGMSLNMCGVHVPDVGDSECVKYQEVTGPPIPMHVQVGPAQVARAPHPAVRGTTTMVVAQFPRWLAQLGGWVYRGVGGEVPCAFSGQG
jgi:hypothetical protein